MLPISKKLLILVDGSFYLYRAYYALPPLLNSIGESTGAMCGVLNMLRTLFIQYQPSHALVVFDAKGKTFRDELFSQYKSKRPIMPKDLRSQIEPLCKITQAMGLPTLIQPDVEADDVIGTLALQAEMTNYPVLISSGDKDMAQLVTTNVSLINTTNNTTLGPKEIHAKYGIPPKLIVDFLALMGDTSDSIPGIPGVGKKTALALLQNLGGLDVIYDKLHNISTLKFRGAKTITAKLEQNKKIAYLSYQLATIKTNVKLNIAPSNLKISTPDLDTLYELFKRYELKRWLANIQSSNWVLNSKFLKVKKITTEKHEDSINKKTNTIIEKIIDSKSKYITILDEHVFDDWLQQLKNTNVFAFNTETNELDTLNTTLIGLAFAIKPGKSAYLPIAHEYPHAPVQLDCYAVMKKLKPLLQDKTILKVGRNLKYDIGILAKYGIKLCGIAYDTMIEDSYLNTLGKCDDIHDLANQYLRREMITCKEITGKSKVQLMFNQVTLTQATFYAAKNIDITLQLHLLIWTKLKKNSQLTKIFHEIDMPLITVLSHLERTGVLIDPNILLCHSKDLKIRLNKLEIKAYNLAGELFNLASTKQLQTILYEKQKMPIIKKTPGGLPSTNEDVLTELAINYKLPKIILEYRSLAKLKTTYTDKLPIMINPISGRLHTSYHQTVTATGRLSSREPNLQNIPIRTNEGRRIRQAFVAPINYKIITADYSQIELRIMAHLSQDAELINAFTKGEDVHCITASEIFEVPVDKVDSEKRRSAKTINFGLIYGMSTFGLAHQLGVTQNKAKAYLKRYFKRYSGVLNYMNYIRQQVAICGYVTTMHGRRIYLQDANSSNNIQRKAAERAAINGPMQGTAADIIKCAMIKIDDWIQKQEIPLVRMIMQVHDELVFEVHESVTDTSSQYIRELMENSITLSVPLKVDMGVGTNWSEAH